MQILICHMEAFLEFFLMSCQHDSVSLSLFPGIFFFLNRICSVSHQMETVPLWILGLCHLPLSFAGNFDWVGNDFTQNAGTGLVINQADVRNNTSIIKQLKDVFERDWYSPYARTLQPTKQPNCSGLFKLRPPSNKTATYNASGKDPSSVSSE